MIVEFVGVPAVGKTYLYKKLLRRDKRGLSLSKVERIAKKSFDKTLNSAAKMLLSIRLKKISENYYSPFDAYFFTKYSLGQLEKYVKACRVGQHVFMEEGIVHNFGDCLHELGDLFEDFKKNIVVIYCVNSPENIVHNIKKRAGSGGHVSPKYRGKGDEELCKIIAASQIEQGRIIEFLSERGVPVLIIDTSAKVEENLEKIQKFLDDKSIL